MTLPGENDITAIKKFFEDSPRPLKQGEFMDFWKNLSEEEKQEFRTAELG